MFQSWRFCSVHQIPDFKLRSPVWLTLTLVRSWGQIINVRVKLADMVKGIARREGFFGFFKGFNATLASAYPGQALYFISYEFYKDHLLGFASRHQTNNSMLNEAMEFGAHAAAGFLADASSLVIYVPSDIVSQRLQVVEDRVPASSVDVVRRIWRAEGIRGFYRGVGVTVATYSVGSAIWWATYEMFKTPMGRLFGVSRNGLPLSSTDAAPPAAAAPAAPSTLAGGSSPSTLAAASTSLVPGLSHIQPSVSEATSSSSAPPVHDWRYHSTHMTAGALAGLVSGVLSNPLDVAKTRMQVPEYKSHSEASAREHKFLPVFRGIYKTEGIRGLYKGIVPRILISMPCSALTFLGYEYVKRMSRLETPA
ncbi:hypothetical protein, variant [Capsaspora owczarzaki ATCC 30864]|uniref:Uncharacterized protein n=1 Tax=Capsaspora owczarzaki (strain ATCC 30864) TaxID=595528 RepID=A0A0D2UCJ0_CAPO3|nr:hypothetical protein, variant [Capsaspora owczarzaki ATCC 30864]